MIVAKQAVYSQMIPTRIGVMTTSLTLTTPMVSFVCKAMNYLSLLNRDKRNPMFTRFRRRSQGNSL